MYDDDNDNLPGWLRRLTLPINSGDWTTAFARLLGAGAGCLGDADNFRPADPRATRPAERSDWSAWGNSPDGRAITNSQAAQMFREFYAGLDPDVLGALRREARRWYAQPWKDEDDEVWCGPRDAGYRPALISAALGLMDQCQTS